MMANSHFARSQLLKHGWTDGCGLGRDEGGIKEAIKVKIKNNKTGVGHNLGKEFTHHWWDDVFNKTANSITVEADQDGAVTVRKTSLTSKQTRTEEKERRRKSLYGNFVMGATLKQQDGRHVEEQIENSSSESEEEQIRKPSEDELFEQCGGRTAHKGARHGLKQNGKLLRIQKMEAKLMEELKLANPNSSFIPSANESPLLKEDDSSPPKKKKKKKRKKDIEENCEAVSNGELECITTVLPKKKKKKKKHGDIEDCVSNNEAMVVDANEEGSLVENKRKDNNSENEDADCNGAIISHEETSIRKKKKKGMDKKRDRDCENIEIEDTEHKKKKKKKKKCNKNE